MEPDRYATKEVPWPSVVPALLGSIATSTTIPAPDQGDRRRGRRPEPICRDRRRCRLFLAGGTDGAQPRPVEMASVHTQRGSCRRVLVVPGRRVLASSKRGHRVISASKDTQRNRVVILSNNLLGRGYGDPMYQQIAAALCEEIEPGKLKPGQQLPTEPELRDLFGASRNIVRDAIKVRQHGRTPSLSEAQVEIQEESAGSLPSLASRKARSDISPTPSGCDKKVAGIGSLSALRTRRKRCFSNCRPTAGYRYSNSSGRPSTRRGPTGAQKGSSGQRSPDRGCSTPGNPYLLGGPVF